MEESIQLENIRSDLKPTGASSRSLASNEGLPASNQDQAEIPELHNEPDDPRKRLAWSRIQLFTLCYCMFVEGWNDGSLGPLLLRIEEDYHVSYTIVSLIFVVTCVGVCVGASINLYGTERVGFGKLMVIGLCCQVTAHCIQASHLPFPVFVLSYGIYGTGGFLYVSQTNGYVAALKEGKQTKLGLLHCAYGTGAFSSPLLATHFAQLKRWNLFFISSVCLALVAVVLVAAVFRFQRQDDCLLKIGQLPGSAPPASDRSNIRQIWSHSSVHTMTAFLFFYVGVEVTVGGWIVTYIIQIRGGGPSSGYISSGFFAGLAIGRIALLWVTSKLGERRAVFLYAALALGLELIVWLVPSLTGNAIAVSLVGVLLGPMYPIAISYTSHILPRWLLTSSIGWIAGLGQMGSAILPFATGALANRFGIKSLQPFLVAMMSCMAISWAFLPKTQHRHD